METRFTTTAMTARTATTATATQVELSRLLPEEAHGCVACGYPEMRSDVVVDRGALLLLECPRCEHRSTDALPLPLGPARARP